MRSQAFGITRQCLILVGGKGTRLGGLSAATPKPLMPLGEDDVFLDRLIFEVARHGFSDIVLLAGHFGDQIASRYHGRTVCGAFIQVVIETEPAGTAGAIRGAAAMLQPTFLFCNGDTLFDINLRRLNSMLIQHAQAQGVLALRVVPDPARYGTVDCEGSRITGFREKNSGAAGPIYAGIALLRREIVERIDKSPASMETDVFPILAASGALIGTCFEGYFIDIGLPETLAEAQEELGSPIKRPAVFFDRDGVLNADGGYTHRVEDLSWLAGAKEAVRQVNEAGAFAIVVTNQAGIARGFYDEEAMHRFHRAMSDDLARDGAHIDAFYSCPYHPDGTVEAFRHPDHPERKPNPGMILRALADWPIDGSRSILIGDQPSDVMAAERAGIAAILAAEGMLADIMPDVLRAIAPAQSGSVR